nr:aldo/keto reductase [Nocardia sp. CS682]
MVSGGMDAAAGGSWKLGESTVNRIGLGAMRLPQYGQAFAADAVPRDRGDAVRVLRRAVELGVNHIDTAAFYFSRLRSANELINHALAPYPDELVIAAKVGPRRDRSGNWLEPATPGQLRGEVEEIFANSAAIISTWCICGGPAATRSPSISVCWPSCARPG